MSQIRKRMEELTALRSFDLIHEQNVLERMGETQKDEFEKYLRGLSSEHDRNVARAALAERIFQAYLHVRQDHTMHIDVNGPTTDHNEKTDAPADRPDEALEALAA